MSITYTSRDFNQKTNEAKNSADKHPVFIQTRGETTHVLMSFKQYQKLKGCDNILTMLAMPEADSIEFEPPALGSIGFKAAEFD